MLSFCPYFVVFPYSQIHTDTGFQQQFKDSLQPNSGVDSDLSWLVSSRLVSSRLVMSCRLPYSIVSYYSQFHTHTRFQTQFEKFPQPNSGVDSNLSCLALSHLVSSRLVMSRHLLDFIVSYYSQIHTDTRFQPQFEKSPQPKVGFTVNFSCLASSRLVMSCRLPYSTRISLRSDSH